MFNVKTINVFSFFIKQKKDTPQDESFLEKIN